MSKVACLLIAASVALCGVQCFVAPSTPQTAPRVSGDAIAELQAQTAGAEAPTQTSSAFSPLAFGAALGLLAAVLGSRPALAADLENGAGVFTANCAACHANGNNSIVAEKKIKKEALVTYGKYEVAAIIKQVTNGYGSMPAFGERLGPDDIEDVANYVFDQADKW